MNNTHSFDKLRRSSSESIVCISITKMCDDGFDGEAVLRSLYRKCDETMNCPTISNLLFLECNISQSATY